MYGTRWTVQVRRAEPGSKVWACAVLLAVAAAVSGQPAKEYIYLGGPKRLSLAVKLDAREKRRIDQTTR